MNPRTGSTVTRFRVVRLQPDSAISPCENNYTIAKTVCKGKRKGWSSLSLPVQEDILARLSALLEKFFEDPGASILENPLGKFQAVV
mgnify:CR=1 FL=1